MLHLYGGLGRMGMRLATSGFPGGVHGLSLLSSTLNELGEIVQEGLIWTAEEACQGSIGLAVFSFGSAPTNACCKVQYH